MPEEARCQRWPRCSWMVCGKDEHDGSGPSEDRGLGGRDPIWTQRGRAWPDLGSTRVGMTDSGSATAIMTDPSSMRAVISDLSLNEERGEGGHDGLGFGEDRGLIQASISHEDVGVRESEVVGRL